MRARLDTYNTICTNESNTHTDIHTYRDGGTDELLAIGEILQIFLRMSQAGD